MSAEMIEESPSYGPFTTAVLYYTLVLGIAELSRRALDRIFSKSSTIHRFFIEFIGTVTICVCVFENGVILVNYGIWAFFIVSTILGYFFGTLGRGAFGTPMGPVEQFIYGEMPLSKLLILFVAEFLGGAFAWRITMELWRQSLYYTGTHFEFYKNSLNDCDLHHKHAFYIMIAFEIFGAFVMRTVIPKIPEKVANFLIPAFISGIFSFSIMYIGDAGLDPIVASSLFYGCRGLSQQWFILQYWICPIIGWLLAAALDRRSRVKAKKPKKETVKKEGKNKPVKKEKQQ